jgi:radical SAM protein with 4Fe4S-binding SPASM domain
MLFILRVLNFVETLLLYKLSLIIKKPLITNYPFSIHIEPTNACMLKCIECPVSKNEQKKGTINIQNYEKLIKSVYKRTFYLNLYFQGEPLLHPQIDYLISFARKHKMIVVLSTNAQLINNEMAIKIIKSKLSKIIISMDGFSQKTYEKYRVGGSIDKVKEAILNIVNNKKALKSKKPKIIVQFLVNRYNEHEIIEIKQWIKSFKNKVKLKLKTMQIYNDFNFLPENEKYRRYIKINDKWERKKKLKNKCFRLWSDCVVTHDGNVLPCCFDKNSKYIMGNILKQDFSQIWKSKEFINFRKNILKNRKNVDICLNCTE